MISLESTRSSWICGGPPSTGAGSAPGAAPEAPPAGPGRRPEKSARSPKKVQCMCQLFFDPGVRARVAA
eukprot:9473268-Pyramimonas_sp.AAC.1